MAGRDPSFLTYSRSGPTENILCSTALLQVYDLADNRPAPVLRALWHNLQEREAAGDKRAAHIRRWVRPALWLGPCNMVWQHMCVAAAGDGRCAHPHSK